MPRAKRTGFTFATLDPDREMEAVSSLLAWSFAFPPERARGWLESQGLEHTRVLRTGKATVAALLEIPMGQFFGGWSVPTVGIAGVGVAPEHRGTGAGQALMRATVHELHQRSVALSTLYPSTQKLYRESGWEVAGGRYEIRIAPSLIRVRETAGKLRPMEPADRPAVERLFRASAIHVNGELDRAPYIWGRVLEPRDKHARGFVVEDGGKLEGYAVLFEEDGEAPYHALVATDLRAVTRRGALRLLSLLADHKTLARTVTWRGGPTHPCLHLLPERGYEVRLRDPWMVRICHVGRALGARGYPPGMRAQLHLDVKDDAVPKNGGRWVLDVSDGIGRAERGGRGRLKLDVRALAALYTGHLQAETLAIAGKLSGSARELAAASAVFAGPVPSMTDMF